MLGHLIDLLVPPRCVACRASLPAAAGPLCGGCRRELPWIAQDRCRRCGLPSPCRPCPATRAAFEHCWAPFAHEGVARELVIALKFRAALPLAQTMAAQLAATAPESLLTGTTLVPVPPYPARARARGFDQATALARALSKRTGLPLAACLHRARDGSRQLGAGRAQRRAPGRLEIRARHTKTPPIALLVDDVNTTGATLHACALALRAAGARHVRAITYTRTLP